MVEIPYQMLTSETLNALIEDFVTRDGTDYGERECSVETKVAQVFSLIKSGEIVIAFDDYSQTCNLILRKDAIKAVATSFDPSVESGSVY